MQVCDGRRGFVRTEADWKAAGDREARATPWQQPPKLAPPAPPADGQSHPRPCHPLAAPGPGRVDKSVAQCVALAVDDGGDGAGPCGDGLASARAGRAAAVQVAHRALGHPRHPEPAVGEVGAVGQFPRLHPSKGRLVPSVHAGGTCRLGGQVLGAVAVDAGRLLWHGPSPRAHALRPAEHGKERGASIGRGVAAGGGATRMTRRGGSPMPHGPQRPAAPDGRPQANPF